jgi:predicted ATPase
MLSPRESSAFVGRGREVEALRAAWEQARSGSRRLVLVAGEAGIGKTRLLSELALGVHDHGAVLYAACQEEALVSYQPFVEALRHYARSTGLDWARVALGPGGRELARLIPELAATLPAEEVGPSSDRETHRYLLFEAVSLFLSETSASTPLVLVLDDLQWADRATLRLLRHVIRAPHEASLLVVGTYRDQELGREHPLSELLADLRRERLFERIRLDGLDERSVGELIASHAGYEASAGLVSTVFEHTEGNPFFVEEVMRHLIETGVLFERGGRWSSALTPDEIGVPEGVKEVLARRLGRLSESCQGVLSHAAVLGRSFSFDVLRAMAELDEDALIDALEEAVDAQLIVEARGRFAPGYAFTHALVRETLYGSLSGPRRQRLHRRAAATLEQQHGLEPGPTLVEIAFHLCEAAPAGADGDRALTLIEQAAEWVLAQGAYEQAVALLTRALMLVRADDGERTRRLRRTRAIAFQRLSHATFDLLPTET